LFQAHGVECVQGKDWIVFPKQGVKANGEVFDGMVHPNGLTIQLDVRFSFATNQTIIESFAGIGQTRDEAFNDAVQNFAANSLHVLLATFLNENDKEVTVEEWSIAGKRKVVTIGKVGIRGKPPVQGEELVKWFGCFEEKIKNSRLADGTHWVRLYYGQIDHKSLTCEVLLDNEHWSEMQTEMAAFAWPTGPDFYSVRIFLIIRDSRVQ
jgi:hypothetical protein